MGSFYRRSLVAVILLSIYPVYMGARVIAAYFIGGYVNAADYPKYIIPYTPVCITIITVTALLPLAVKLCKRFAHFGLSVLGIGMFLLTETLFERVTVFDSVGFARVETWQTYLCMATPQVVSTLDFKQTIGAELAGRYSPVFKVHFYLIAILIVLAVTGVIYGFYKMVVEKKYEKKAPLIAQTISVSVFVGLCIFACFTAFYRTGEINISALSSWLMSIFFIVFGITAGAYAGGLLYGKRFVLSRLTPAIIAAATATAMYVGELMLMGGVLFKFGKGLLFDPISGMPFAIIDIFVIIITGLLTFLICVMLNRVKGKVRLKEWQ